MQSWPAPTVPKLPGTGVPLRLFDTADRQVRPVSPGETATMYVCGITPYDATHLGHAATYLAFDLVNRVWRDNGHDVVYVQNVTDVDDPLFERADRDGEDWIVLGSAVMSSRNSAVSRMASTTQSSPSRSARSSSGSSLSVTSWT